MSNDVLITGGIATAQLITTIYGVFVSVTEKHLKRAVIIGLIGGVGVALTVWAAIRSDQAQQVLAGQLSAIQKNTEKQPIINIPPQPAPVINFPTPTQHSSLAWLHPQQMSPAGPLVPFTVGVTPRLNMGYRNAGTVSISSSEMRGVLIVVPYQEDPTAPFKKYGPQLLQSNPNRHVTGTLPTNSQDYAFYTFIGPPLTQSEVDGLNNGTMMLCGLAIADWTDTTGKYRTDFGHCLWHQYDGTWNFHATAENNREEKVK